MYLIHRDVKPENFLIGSKTKTSIIHIIDFGLAKFYRNIRTQSHLPLRTGKGLVGTARYVSINTHHGVEQSRRDDIEGVLYMLIYFLKGKLPWQGLKEVTKENRYNNICYSKNNTPLEVLCSDLPSI